MKNPPLVHHPEHEGILVDRIKKGDISSWSHATSKPFGSQFKPIRPEVGRVRAAFTPIKSLKALGVLDSIKEELARRRKHNPEGIILPVRGKFDYEERAEKVNRRTLAIANRFEELYRQSAKQTKKAKVIAVPAALPDPLADCPATSPEVLARLKGNMMPRDL
jgi:hypothetical protein